MIYPDVPNFTLLVEKMEIMIITDILVRCKMTDNEYVQSILILAYTCRRQMQLWELLYTKSHFSIKLFLSV